MRGALRLRQRPNMEFERRFFRRTYFWTSVFLGTPFSSEKSMEIIDEGRVVQFVGMRGVLRLWQRPSKKFEQRFFRQTYFGTSAFLGTPFH